MADGKLVPKCGATKGNGTGKCQNPAGYGTGHPGVGPCKWHFGATPVHEAKYAVYNLRHTAIDIMATHGPEWARDLKPADVLKEELRRSYIMINVFESLITIEDAMWPEFNKVLLDERKHSVDVAAKMITLGLAERELQVMEAEAALFGQSIRVILERLQLTDDQRRQAPIIVREVLAGLPVAA